MRGKQGLGHKFAYLVRIIPARAGQTPIHVISSMVIPDHPRACGANNDATPLDMRDGGSSPRVRGKRHQQHGHKPGDRIIPARAGQTTHASYHAEPSTDHPRACGANRAFTCLCLLRFGSSPRVRGKRHMAGRPIWPVRIIPARAGQTCYV